MLACVIYGELVALGANGALLSVLAAFAQIVLAVGVIVFLPLDLRFWRGAWFCLPLALATILIAFLPAWGRGVPGIDAAHAQWLTPDMAGAGLAHAGGAWAMLLAGAGVGYQRGGSRRFVDCLLVGAAVYIPFALLLWQFAPHTVWGLPKGINTDRFTGTMLNANASGCVFGVIALLGFARWCEATATGARRFAEARKLALALLVLAGLGACTITGSRTALSLCLLGIVVEAGKARLSDRSGGFIGHWERIQSRRWLALAALTTSILAILLVVGSATFDRVGTVSGDFGGRLAIWSYYLAIAKQAPTFGYGPASFGSANLLHMTRPELYQYWYIAAAHNMMIGVVIEHGWIVLALEMLVVALIALAIWQSHVAISRAQLKLAIVLALVFITGCASVDIALDVPAVLTIAIALLGSLWGQAIRQERNSGRE